MSYTTEQERERREWVARCGLCAKCKCRAATEGKSTCDECRRYLREVYRAKRIAAGHEYTGSVEKDRDDRNKESESTVAIEPRAAGMAWGKYL